MSAEVQVSICEGATIPESRPEGWAEAASQSASAASIPARPAASSQAYSTLWPLRVDQRAERYMGASTVRRPLRAACASQPSQATERSTRVVVPESRSSP